MPLEGFGRIENVKTLTGNPGIPTGQDMNKITRVPEDALLQGEMGEAVSVRWTEPLPLSPDPGK
jgi:hypothetical protein